MSGQVARASDWIEDDREYVSWLGRCIRKIRDVDDPDIRELVDFLTDLLLDVLELEVDEDDRAG